MRIKIFTYIDLVVYIGVRLAPPVYGGVGCCIWGVGSMPINSLF